MGRSVYYLHYLTFLRVVVYTEFRPVRTLDLFGPLVPRDITPVPQGSIQLPVLGTGTQRKFGGLRNLSLSNLLPCSLSLYLHYNIFQRKLSSKNYKRLKVFETSPREWKSRMLPLHHSRIWGDYLDLNQS